jgi:diguanylate cyclase (GGDEF)-like protein
VTAPDSHDAVEELSRFLLDTLTLTQPPEAPAAFTSIDSFKVLHADLLALREFLYAASNGDLSREIGFKGFVAGTLKTLQANLRHIVWQTQMVASGDFTQRVEFIGDFSQSFNEMVMRLDQTLKELVAKEDELQQANEDLRLLAISDPLTGLNNRRHFFELAEAEIGRALRYSRPLALMMFDIDFFKHVNDTYGHTAGDAVLKMVADAASMTMRSTDISARYGGEEFVVLLPETEVGVAASAAERLRERIETATVQVGEQPIKVTASFGVNGHLARAASEAPEKVLLDFVDKADQALYAAKDAGRNRVAVCRPD